MIIKKRKKDLQPKLIMFFSQSLSVSQPFSWPTSSAGNPDYQPGFSSKANPCAKNIVTESDNTVWVCEMIP
jgi:hypothetical protein